MNKIILLYSFIIVSISIYSQDTLFVEGYYIKRFEKKEIEFKMYNESLEANGKSYERMIDYKVQSYFFSLKINSNITLMKKNEITSILSNVNYKNIEVFKFPPFNDYINNYLANKNINISNTEFPKDNDYYLCKNDSTHLYEIYKIEGYALRVKLNKELSTPKEYFALIADWNIIPLSLNQNIPSFYVYLFYKCNIIRCDLPPEGFIKWSPN